MIATALRCPMEQLRLPKKSRKSTVYDFPCYIMLT